MSSFKRKETVASGARRIVCAELESAIQALSRQGKRATSAAANDALSRASACLELVAPLLPNDTARQDRKRLAQVRRTLAEARRGRRLVARLDRQVKQAKLDGADPTVKALRKSLTSSAGGAVALQSRGRRFDPLVYRLVAELAELRGRVGHWPEKTTADKADALPPGLVGCYRKAQAAAERGAQTPDGLDATGAALGQLVEAMTLIAKACPALLKPHRTLIADAADAAERHTLDTLLAQSAGSLEADSPLHALLRDAPDVGRADALRLIAHARAFALAETPQAFARRAGAYWQAWRSAD